MTRFYSDPSREDETYALPDCEVFELTAEEVREFYKKYEEEGDESIEGGWFYWYCFPGCMPEGPPMGPYDTQEEAIEAAREEVW
jgi:hypothetical protein